MLTLFQVRGKPANEEHIDTVCSSSTALQLNVHIYMQCAITKAMVIKDMTIQECIQQKT